MSWLSKAWNGISGFFSDAAPIIDAATSIFGTIQGNKNVDKSLAAQQQENEAVREYEREVWTANNAYNSPLQQKARLEAAGLNSDMMYGQGGVSNTSPAPPHSVAPMDWSSLAGKRTVGDAIMQSLAIEQARANVRKTNAEAGGQEINNDFAPLEHALGFELTQSEIDKNRAELSRLNADVERMQALTLNLKQDTVNKALEYVFKNKSMQYELRSLAAKASMAENELEYHVKTLMARVAYQDAVKDKARYEADEAKFKKDITEWQKNTLWWNEFLKVWDKGITTFETYLEFKGFVDETEEYYDRDGNGDVLSKTTKRTHKP